MFAHGAGWAINNLQVRGISTTDESKYHFICSSRKNNSAQPTSEALTHTIDKLRAGIKSNQKERIRRENVSSN